MSDNETAQPARLLTLFDLFKFGGALMGAVAASSFGYRTFGWPAAIVAAPLGLIAGAFIGNLPWIATDLLMRYELKRSSSARLKQRLESEFFISHLLIAELVSRGEPLEQFRDYVTGLMRSADPHQRYFGHAVARIWFPDALPPQPGPSKLEDPKT